jgi:DNA-binding transcriptional MerR regulator
MLKIGDFSKLGRVSIVALRHYDDLGLLKPATIDPDSGYRYYSVDQLPRLNRILALKDLGFSLEQVARLLSDELPAAQIRGMLILKRAELEQQVTAQQHRLVAVEARLRHIEREGANPSYDVRLRAGEPLLVATIREVVPAADGIERLFDEVEVYAAAHRARAAGPPLAIYHDTDYRERNLDVEVAVPLSAPLPGTGHVTVSALSGFATLACTIHSGSYATIDQAYSTLYGWIATHGYAAAGPHREVYLRFGVGAVDFTLPAVYLTNDSGEYVTELQVPVEKA